MGLIFYPAIAGYKDYAPLGLMDSGAMPGIVYFISVTLVEKNVHKE